jgi:peptidoglycan/xylan/chitin deacetylase (PgdA/CDA1 family)
MMIVVIKPWQAHMLLGLLFAIFLAGGYHIAQSMTLATVSGPPVLDQPVFEISGAGNLIALCINVDWGTEEIPSMLDIFDNYHAQVTFFLTGSWLEKNQELARQMVARGHEVANHGAAHAHPKQLSDQALVKHMADSAELIRRILGKETRLYAPPYGEWDRRIVQTAAKLGYYTILWTLDTIDWQDPSAATIVQRIVPKAKGGSIVLMHPRPNSVSALPQMLEGLQAKGLKAVTLSTMMEASRANTTAGSV